LQSSPGASLSENVEERHPHVRLLFIAIAHASRLPFFRLPSFCVHIFSLDNNGNDAKIRMLQVMLQTLDR
jgi:hypothetical protein